MNFPLADTKIPFVPLIIGAVFGYSISLFIHCKMDLTSVAVAAVAAIPVLAGNFFNYKLGKSNRTLIWNMHEENSQKLETIRTEVKKNGS